MCSTCGCSGEEGGYKIFKPGEKPETADFIHSNHEHHGHSHSHSDDHTHAHDHSHPHEHSHSHNEYISIEQDILGANNLLAQRNRGYFEAKNIIAFNLVSSPGSGKTSLLERTIKESSTKFKSYVIEGDQQTDNDAKRIAATGAEVLQINTGNACHLDADMVHQALHELKPIEKSVVFIENVGNLVCPALFDLGETKRVVIFSVTEGEDKPLKYRNMFHTSDLCIISKTDLLPYVDFNIKTAKENILKVNPKAEIIELSVKSGDDFTAWIRWITDKI